MGKTAATDGPAAFWKGIAPALVRQVQVHSTRRRDPRACDSTCTRRRAAPAAYVNCEPQSPSLHVLGLQVCYSSLAMVLFEPIRDALVPAGQEPNFGQRLLAGGAPQPHAHLKVTAGTLGRATAVAVAAVAAVAGFGWQVVRVHFRSASLIRREFATSFTAFPPSVCLSDILFSRSCSGSMPFREVMKTQMMTASGGSSAIFCCLFFGHSLCLRGTQINRPLLHPLIDSPISVGENKCDCCTLRQPPRWFP
eukprot:SAG11_NODE_2325_length_3521_cov_4.278995_3_plen_251_part_00